jgi:hypothetical protein
VAIFGSPLGTNSIYLPQEHRRCQFVGEHPATLVETMASPHASQVSAIIEVSKWSPRWPSFRK